MTTAVLVLLVAAIWLAAVLLWRQLARQVDQSDLQCLGLKFPRGLERARVEQFLTTLTGLLPPWWKRWFHSPVVTFEIVATADAIRHHLVFAERSRHLVETALRTHLPDVRAEAMPLTELRAATASEYRTTAHHRLLRVSTDVVSTQLLGTLARLGTDETVNVAWTITPGSPPAVPMLPATDNSRWMAAAGPRSALRSAADVAALKEKQTTAIMMTVARIGVSAPDGRMQRRLLRRVESAYYSTAAPGVHLRRRSLPTRFVAGRINRRSTAGVGAITVNCHELAALIGWPTGTTSVPGLTLSRGQVLPVSPAVPTTGTVLGDGITAGTARPVAVDLDARLHHFLVLGATGTGKTSLLIQMAVADAVAGHGVLVVDPKGADLVDGFLERLPDEHHERVVVLDPADVERPVGIDPLRPRGIAAELAVEHVVGILHQLFAASWGQRSDDIWRAALRTIVTNPDGTLADVGPLLTDRAVRRARLEHVHDPVLHQFWRSFSALSDAEAAQWVGPVLNKWRTVFARPSLRRIFAQVEPTLDLAGHLDTGGIVVVPLNTGLIGTDAAALFAAILLGQVWVLIQRRVGSTHRRQRPLMLHLDEFARYASLPVPFEELLSQARSYRVGLTMAAQHLHQLPVELRHAVLSNPRSRLAFQVGGTDARTLAQEFGLGLSAEDFQDLDAFSVVAQLHAAARTQPAASLTTRPLPLPTASPETVRRLSRERWGADGAAVDASLHERLSGTNQQKTDTATPTGRKRRQP